MAEKISIDPEIIKGCGKEISNLAHDADALKQQCKSAEVPDQSWGLVGVATTFSSYKELLGKLQEHLGKVSKGISEAGDKLTQCGEIYQGHEDTAVGELEKINAMFAKGGRA